jgi:hypothetical protein
MGVADDVVQASDLRRRAVAESIANQQMLFRKINRVVPTTQKKCVAIHWR